MHTSELAPDRGASAGNFRLYQFCRRLFIEGIRRTNGSGGKRLSHAPISGGRGFAMATRFAATALLALGTLTAVATLSANDAQAQSVTLSKPNDTTLRLTYTGILETNGGASAGCSDDDPIPLDCIVFIQTRIDLPTGTVAMRENGRTASTPNYTLMLSAIEGINNIVQNGNQIFITVDRELLDGTVGSSSDGGGIIDVAIATQNVVSDTFRIAHGRTRTLNGRADQVGTDFTAVNGSPQTFSVVGAATVLVGQPMVSIVGEDAEIGTGGAATGGMASFIVRVENFDATDAPYTAINIDLSGAEAVSPAVFGASATGAADGAQSFTTTSFTVTIDSSARAAHNVTNDTQPFFATTESGEAFRLMLPSDLFTATNGTAGDIGDEDITINIATKAGATPRAMPVFTLGTPGFHTDFTGGLPSASRGSGDLPVAGDPADHITFTIVTPTATIGGITNDGEVLRADGAAGTDFTVTLSNLLPPGGSSRNFSMELLFTPDTTFTRTTAPTANTRMTESTNFDIAVSGAGASFSNATDDGSLKVGGSYNETQAAGPLELTFTITGKGMESDPIMVAVQAFQLLSPPAVVAGANEGGTLEFTFVADYTRELVNDSRLETLVVAGGSALLTPARTDATPGGAFASDRLDYGVVLPFVASNDNRNATITVTLPELTDGTTPNPRESISRAHVRVCAAGSPTTGLGVGTNTVVTSGVPQSVTGIGDNETVTLTAYVTSETVATDDIPDTCAAAETAAAARDDSDIATPTIGTVTAYSVVISVAPSTGSGVLGVADDDDLVAVIPGPLNDPYDKVDIPIVLSDIPQSVYDGMRLVPLTDVDISFVFSSENGLNDFTTTRSAMEFATPGIALTNRTTGVVFNHNPPPTNTDRVSLRVPASVFGDDGTGTIMLRATARAAAFPGAISFFAVGSSITYVIDTGTANPTGPTGTGTGLTAGGTSDVVFNIVADDRPLFATDATGVLFPNQVFTLRNPIGGTGTVNLPKITDATATNTPITYRLDNVGNLPAGLSFNAGTGPTPTPTLMGTPTELVDSPLTFTLDAIDMDLDESMNNVEFTIAVITGPPDGVIVRLTGSEDGTAAATRTVDEDAGPVTITLHLPNPLRPVDLPDSPNNTLTLNYTFNDGGGDAILGSTPTAGDFSINAASDCGTGTCTGATGTIVFVAGDQTKTIVLDIHDDDLDESSQDIVFRILDGMTGSTAAAAAFDLASPVSPTDSTPNRFTVDDTIDKATITITDNDMAGVTLSETSLAIVEGSTGVGTNTYTVALNSRPTADVVIGITVTGADVTVESGGSGPVPPVALTFTNTDWGTPQTVTVTAREPAVHAAGATATIAHAITTVDTDYTAYGATPGIPDVTVTVTDNDPSSVTVSTNATQISESREEEAIISVSLNRPVTHSTTIQIPFTIAIVRDDEQPDSVADEDDYDVSYTGAPGCTLTPTTTTPCSKTSGTLNFATGDQTHTINISAVMDDIEDEGDQDITFRLGAGPDEGVAFSPADMVEITLREIATEEVVVKTEIETVTTLIGAEQVGSISGLIRARFTSPVSVVASAPAVPDTATALHLPDNPQVLGDMLNGLGLEHTASADGGGVYAVWARGTYTSMEGDPTVDGMKVDYDGDSTGLGIGVEKVTGRYVAGVAMNWLTTDLDLRSEDDEGLSKYEESLLMVAPYLALRRDNGRSFWISAGYGAGDADGTTAADGATASADVSVSFLNAGADFVLTTHQNGELIGSLSTLAVRKTVDSFTFEGTDTITATTLSTFRGQGEVTYYRTVEAGDGRIVKPYVGLATLHDAGDKLNDDSHALDLRGGGEFHGEKINASLEISTELLRKDHKSWSISGSARYLFSPEGLGASLTLDGAHATDSNMGMEGGYGMMVREVHKDALLTPFAGLKHGSGGNGEFSSGLRLAIGSEMDADLRAARAFGNDEDTLKLNFRRTF